tara:strand:+ start:181 stop:504 length:324 start_codon:yes stop_codon:yes gene_type:complete
MSNKDEVHEEMIGRFLEKYTCGKLDEIDRLHIDRFTKNGCYLVIDTYGNVRCADNYEHALELTETQEPTLLALNEEDATEQRLAWKQDHTIPCPPIKILEYQKGETA